MSILDVVTAITERTAVQPEGPAKDSVLLGKYRVEETLGVGGMGFVIRAHAIAMDESVAIKFPRDDASLDPELVERFLREAKAAGQLRSEHVAKIRDVGTLEDGRPYMVMELLEGINLGKLLVDQGSIDAPRAVDLMLQACDALAEAHALGIVHRDIKPSNLFITRRRDGSELLKVLDFGISKVHGGVELSLTQSSSMLGTPAYMSPEQMRSARTADSRSDIWALGTVLYELVEGRLPFKAANFADLSIKVSTEPPAPMTKAPHLERVIRRCLAKPIDGRYQDIAELAQELAPYASDPGIASHQVACIQRVLGKQPSGRDSTPTPMAPMAGDSMRTRRPTAVTRPPLRSRSDPWKRMVILVFVIGLGIGIGLYVTRGGAIADADETAIGAAHAGDARLPATDSAAGSSRQPSAN